MHAEVLDLTRGKIRHLKKGAPLFRRGQPCREIFVVRAGVIRLLRPQADGATAVMYVARAGDWVAESSLFAERYHCDAIAESDAIVWSANRAAFLEQLTQDAERSLQLARVFAQRLRELRMLHELMHIRRASQRVLAWLSLHAAGRPPRLTLERTWSALAEDLGLSREALYRALAELRKTGRIIISGKRVQLNAKVALK